MNFFFEWKTAATATPWLPYAVAYVNNLFVERKIPILLYKYLIVKMIFPLWEIDTELVLLVRPSDFMERRKLIHEIHLTAHAQTYHSYRL